jgi:hypothetical protein
VRFAVAFVKSARVDSAWFPAHKTQTKGTQTVHRFAQDKKSVLLVVRNTFWLELLLGKAGKIEAGTVSL